MNALALRIPPAVVFVAAALLMKLASWALPAWHVDVPGRDVPAAAAAIAGLLLGIAGILSFQRAKTTVHPMRPSEASSLVTTGIYTRTRNPMYLGLLMGLIAWGVYLGHPVSLLAPSAKTSKPTARGCAGGYDNEF